MKIKILFATIGLFIVMSSIGQSRLDSLINLRKTERLEGKLPTYYTPGYQEVALDFQNLITEAIAYYEGKYKVQFNVKLLVLDSVQWIREAIPYGFIVFSNGWIVLNTGMNYESFKKVYGVQSYSDPLDREAKRLKIPPSDIVNSLFKFYSIHELGHYFIGMISKAKLPDYWMSEFSASYFSYEFFQISRSQELKPYELFCQVNRDYYKPKYSTIADFNEKYTRTGIENYAWYHSNFFFLVKEMYDCQRTDFIKTLETNFPKGSGKKFTIDETIDILERNCNGIVRKWKTNLETKSN